MTDLSTGQKYALSAPEKTHSQTKMPQMLQEIEELTHVLAPYAQITKEGTVEVEGHSLPIYSFILGSPQGAAPTLAVFGGVHGLEVIGVQVVVAYMRMLAELLTWDKVIHTTLEHMNICFMPCVNPGGLAMHRRSNPRGVDLMRNAPIEAKGINPLFIPAGHRISPKLPWYRGSKETLEYESIILKKFVDSHLRTSPFCLALDIHSGVGASDRLWFPYAHTAEQYPHLAEMYCFKQLLDATIPQHIYTIEPQSTQYRVHGDLWDYFYLEHQKSPLNENLFLPLCLEMGSWAWVRKNPLQILSIFGIYNPIKPHRMARTMRRHLIFLDFLSRATLAFDSWAKLGSKERQEKISQAVTTWLTD